MRVAAVWMVFIALTLPAAVSAQRRQAGSGAAVPTGSSAAIALKADGAPYDFSGRATCEHVPRGSIYNIVAERWSVRHNEGTRHLDLTLWHPLASGQDMMTLSVSTGAKRLDVNTVRGPSSRTSGTGTVRYVPAGNGGTFTVDATTASGARVTGTIRCDAFTAAEVAGG